MEEELNMESVSMNSDEEAHLNGLVQKNERAIKDVEAMKACLQKMNTELLQPFKKLGKKMPWSERLIVVSDSAIAVDEKVDVNNDVQREVQFYNIALGNTRVGLEKVASEGLKLDRPQDYFAEMFKNDSMMTKIRSSLVKAQVKVRNYEEQQLKKHAKKLQKSRKHQKNLEASRSTKTSNMAIEKWKGDIKKKGANVVKDLDEYIKSETEQRLKKKKSFQNIKSKGIQKKKHRPGKDTRKQNFQRKQNPGNKRR